MLKYFGWVSFGGKNVYQKVVTRLLPDATRFMGISHGRSGSTSPFGLYLGRGGVLALGQRERILGWGVVPTPSTSSPPLVSSMQVWPRRFQLQELGLSWILKRLVEKSLLLLSFCFPFRLNTWRSMSLV